MSNKVTCSHCGSHTSAIYRAVVQGMPRCPYCGGLFGASEMARTAELHRLEWEARIRVVHPRVPDVAASLDVKKAVIVARFQDSRKDSRDVSGLIREAIQAWDKKFEDDAPDWDTRPDLQADDGKHLAQFIRDCLVEAGAVNE